MYLNALLDREFLPSSIWNKFSESKWMSLCCSDPTDLRTHNSVKRTACSMGAWKRKYAVSKCGLICCFHLELSISRLLIICAERSVWSIVIQFLLRLEAYYQQFENMKEKVRILSYPSLKMWVNRDPTTKNNVCINPNIFFPQNFQIFLSFFCWFSSVLSLHSFRKENTVIFQ